MYVHSASRRIHKRILTLIPSGSELAVIPTKIKLKKIFFFYTTVLYSSLYLLHLVPAMFGTW